MAPRGQQESPSERDRCAPQAHGAGRGTPAAPGVEAADAHMVGAAAADDGGGAGGVGISDDVAVSHALAQALFVTTEPECGCGFEAGCGVLHAEVRRDVDPERLARPESDCGSGPNALDCGSAGLVRLRLDVDIVCQACMVDSVDSARPVVVLGSVSCNFGSGSVVCVLKVLECGSGFDVGSDGLRALRDDGSVNPARPGSFGSGSVLKVLECVSGFDAGVFGLHAVRRDVDSPDRPVSNCGAVTRLECGSAHLCSGSVSEPVAWLSEVLGSVPLCPRCSRALP